MHAREYYCEVEEADCSMGALNLLCNGDAFLSAASAVLAAASPEPESEEDDDFDVLIRMQGLSKLWAPWAGCVHGARRSRRLAVSSRLQPIDEVAPDELDQDADVFHGAVGQATSE